jgi:hypothetical protein
MVRQRRIIINNFTEEEHESDLFSAAQDVLWNDITEGTATMEDAGSADLFCFAKFSPEEVEIDIYDYRGAKKFTDQELEKR